MKLLLYILLSLRFLQTELIAQRLTIYHIDVGQGDATLIRTSDGHTMLIDAGDNGKGANAVLPFLKNLSITSLDYLIASHYHSDHIGGIDEVIQALSPDSVRQVLDRGTNPPLPTSKTFRQYWSAAQTTAQHRAVYLGQAIKLTDELLLQCLAVDGAVFRCSESVSKNLDENSRSIAWLISFEHSVGDRAFSFRYFTGGDCGGSEDGSTDLENPLARIVGDVDAMKVNHHGSRYSTNQTFLDSLRPEAVVISVGDKNDYGHPDQETLDRVQNTSSVRRIYQTEQGSGGTAAKVEVLGTVTISVFDSLYIVGSDTFQLCSHQVSKTTLVSSTDKRSHAASQARINASVEDGILTLSLAEPMFVSVSLLNVLGQEVDNLPGRQFPPGIHRIDVLDPALPSGVYFVRISTPDAVLVRKACLVH